MNNFVRPSPSSEKESIASRHKTKIDAVSPSSKRDSFEYESVCFLGVSLGNQSFSEPKFKALLEWVATRLDKYHLLIGKYLSHNAWTLFPSGTSASVLCRPG